MIYHQVTVETVPDHIEMQEPVSGPGPGLLNYVLHSLAVYFSNPWALLILAFLLYKLYRHLRPFITEPVLERWVAEDIKKTPLILEPFFGPTYK